MQNLSGGLVSRAVDDDVHYSCYQSMVVGKNIISARFIGEAVK